MKITHSEFSDAGPCRTNNQDRILSVSGDNCGLFAVADGMGGHFGGEIASGRLTEALLIWWEKFIGAPTPFDECTDNIKAVITEVSNSIYNEFSPRGKICGTTIALLFIYDNKYLVINAGDSRVYCRRRGRVSQESVDHVFGTEAKIEGILSGRDIEMNRNKSKLTSAVGCKERFKMSTKTAPLVKCSFFICSDGIYKFCSKKDIACFLRQNDPSALKKKVCNVMEKNGANDNYSYIRIGVVP